MSEINLGIKIRKLRELKNFTQEYMAQQINISVSNYSKLERDEIPLTMNRLNKISKILGIAVIDIISFDEKNILKKNTHHDESLQVTIAYLLKKIDSIEKKLNID